MDDLKTVARILAAVKAGQDSSAFNCALVDARMLHTTDAARDRLALRLQKDGYIDGLLVVDDVDNAPPAVLWPRSRPELTIKGMEYIATNEPVRKAIEEIRDTAVSLAAQTIANTIGGML